MQIFARAGPAAKRSRHTGEASLERVLLHPAVELQSYSTQFSVVSEMKVLQIHCSLQDVVMGEKKLRISFAVMHSRAYKSHFGVVGLLFLHFVKPQTIKEKELMKV